MNISFSLNTANPVHFIIVIVVICLFLAVKTAIYASLSNAICSVLLDMKAPPSHNEIREES